MGTCVTIITVHEGVSGSISTCTAAALLVAGGCVVDHVGLPLPVTWPLICCQGWLHGYMMYMGYGGMHVCVHPPRRRTSNRSFDPKVKPANGPVSLPLMRTVVSIKAPFAEAWGARDDAGRALLVMPNTRDPVMVGCVVVWLWYLWSNSVLYYLCKAVWSQDWACGKPTYCVRDVRGDDECIAMFTMDSV